MSNTWRDLLLNDDAYWLSLLVASLQIIWAGFSVVFALFTRFGLKSQGEGSPKSGKCIPSFFRIRFVGKTFYHISGDFLFEWKFWNIWAGCR